MKKLYKSFIAIAALLATTASAQISQPVGPGGRPQTFTNHGVLIGKGTSNVVATSAGTAGLCLLSGGASADPDWGSCSGGSAGTVTSVSVATANGFLGTVANPTTTPAITIATSVSGILKGNAVAVSAATSGTDYSAGTSALASGIVKSTTGTGALSIGVSGTDYSAGTSALATGILKSTTGTGALTIAASGTDYAPATSGTSILYGSGSGGFSNVTVGSGLQFIGGTLSSTGSGITVIPNYISGYTLSNDGTTPNSVLAVATGYAADSTNATMINGNAAFRKSTAGAWAAGTGNNGMGTGLTIASNTWYHVFAIINNGSYDVYFDTSTTAANKPTNTTAFRYIGSFKTNSGNSNIMTFKQSGQYFYWASTQNDLAGGTAASATLVQLTIPNGFNTVPLFYASSSVGQVYTALGNVAGASISVNGGGTEMSNSSFGPMSNTSGQIYYSTSSAMSIGTIGYINPKVAPNN